MPLGGCANGYQMEGEKMEIKKPIEIKAPPVKVLQWYSTFRKFEYTGNQRSSVGTLIYIEE
jgi:hypothetical protein